VHDAVGTRIPVNFSLPVSSSLPKHARGLGVTPFALLLGAFGLTLSRWTGARKLLIGVPLIGRSTSELMTLIAYTGNLVPVRVDVDDDMTAANYLRSVQDSLLFSIDAGDLPFEELVSRLSVERSAGCHPLVQVSFGMHDKLVPSRICTDSARIRVEEGHGGGSQFDLSLMFERADPQLTGYAEYATSVWTPAEASAFAEDFRAAVTELITATQPAAVVRPLHEVRCMSPGRRAELDAINETRSDFPATSLDELFREAVRRWPAAVAVRDGAAELTYAQLAEAATGQAGRLRAAGVRAGNTVLIGVERSAAEAVAVLGTVSAGAAYVGIDLSQPLAHTARIVAKSAPAAAVAWPEAAPLLERLGVTVVPAWDAAWPLGDGDSPAQPAQPAQPADPARLAYVAFTSGSTGEPRGVAVPHRAVIRLVHEAGYVRLGPGERMLRLSPLAFDASTLELWGALLTGTILEVCPPGLLSPSELGAVLAEREVTIAWLTAGLFRLVEEFAPKSLGGLRQLVTGGDVVPHEHAARALARHTGLIITNGYGPTENTTFTTVYSVTRPEDIDGPLPIGTPVPGTRVYVLDDRGRRVPPGAVGELYAGGEGLADGYLGDEAETARGFGHFSPEVPERLYRTGDMVRIDTSGRLRFLGRADDQVKIRGYRIELTAVRDALTACPGVRDAVVTVTDADSAAKRIVAAVIPVPGVAVTPAELRDSLAEKLPSYMLPTLWALVDRVPVTPNGKVDRRALAAVAVPTGGSGGQPRPAADHPLARVLALFAEAIESADSGLACQLDAESDFFQAGGNSMAAMRLIGMTSERLGVAVRLRDFLLSPTPMGLYRLTAKAASAPEPVSAPEPAGP
jgi:amino acid adenylation domain-containing protein